MEEEAKGRRPLYRTQSSLEREGREYSFYFPSDSDPDLSFTSYTSTTSTDRTFASSSSSSCSSGRTSLCAASNTVPSGRRGGSDPHWSAVAAATNVSPDGNLHLHHLKLMRRVGSGNLGRVFQCRLKGFDGVDFALKVVDREAVSGKKLAQARTEAGVLACLDHPFLPTLYAQLEASHYSCLLIDYCEGGDLHSLMRARPGNRLRVAAARFYAAEVLLALQYLHSKGIVYRDLKPENVLLRRDGHVMLSDFDLCFRADVAAAVVVVETTTPPTTETTRSERGCFGRRRRRRRRAEEEKEEERETEIVLEPTGAYSRSCVGTHEYLAPEVVAGEGHGSGVDWWAFGVFLYEMLYGRSPFRGATKEDTLRNIYAKGLEFPDANGAGEEGGEEGEGGMAEARDLIGRLLAKDPRKRLGGSWGAAEIKRHPFFAGVKWPLIRCYRPPAAATAATRTSSSRDLRVGGIEVKKRRARWSLRRLLWHFGNKRPQLVLNGKTTTKGGKWL